MSTTRIHTMPGMRPVRVPISLVLLGLGLLAGCASTKVSDREEYEGPNLPRPEHIIVYDFAATPEDLPAWTDLRETYADSGADVRPDELAAGRKLGADVAKELVAKIDKMGLNAVRAVDQPDPEIDDIMLVGYFSSIDKGSGVERVLIGFGEGAASVGVHADGYHETGTGPVKLGGGDVDSAGGKGPGLVVPALITVATANPIGLVVSGAAHAASEATGHSTAKGGAERIADEIAKILEGRFKEEGWI
jgi:hypothetical protein